MNEHRVSLRIAMSFVTLFIFGSIAAAQGVQTATLRGTILDDQQLPVPHARITATSPVLQGERSVISDEAGMYEVRALPPGDYLVRAELEGFSTVSSRVTLALGLDVRRDLTLHLAAQAVSV